MRLTSLVVLTLIFTGCSAPPEAETAGTLITNVRGYTPTSTGITEFSELHIRDAVVIATGNGELAERGEYALQIDGNGQTLLPGLIDAHGHVSSLGRAVEQIDLVGSASLDDALGRIKRFAEANPDVPWLLGRGWNQVLWSDSTFPDRADLDQIVSDRPVYLGRIDGHAAWANSLALERAGITAATLDPEGGRLLRDSEGQPTGILIDAAMDSVNEAIPAPTEKDIRRYYLTAIKRLASLGVTGTHDAGVNIREIEVLREMDEQGELSIRLYSMLSGAGEVLDFLQTPQIDSGSELLAIRSVKIYSDGALGSRGAALIEPYTDEPSQSGLVFDDVETLSRHIEKANRMGFQANVHAIGDFANRLVLDAFERARKSTTGDFRNRVEHAQVIHKDDFERYATMGIIASVQPTHATSDKNMAQDRLGPERIKGAYAWRTMLDSSIRIAGGSDYPVEPANPMFGLHAAVTRQDRGDLPVGGWYVEQALTREEALRAFTVDAAYAAHQEDRLGRLQSGYQADFILIDKDYFEVPASDIWKLKVQETWVAGQQVYKASTAQ